VTSITVGVPYRNEGQDFALLAGGLRGAAGALPPGLDVEFLICVNGSGERFAAELEERVASSDLATLDVKVISSAEGKLQAMRAIADCRRLRGYLAFVDSDVVLAPNVLRRLWEVLETHPDCRVSYGQPVPVFPYRGNWVHRLSRVHYALRDRAYQRPYFHGRAFMLREWFFEEPSSPETLSPGVVRRLKLRNGPVVDDIAMSLMAVARWGSTSIREVPEANVYFDPPDDLRGLYAGALRVALELERLKHLYPHYCSLQADVLRKSWRKADLARFSWRVRGLHAAHRLLDALVHAAARLHASLVRVGLVGVDTFWVRVAGTKAFARHRRSWTTFKRHR